MPRFLSLLGVIPLLLACASPAVAGKLFVAANGVDGPGCGAKTAPCRSITNGIANAVAGDTVIVGPGQYHAFVETPAPGCGCMLAFNKAVHLESSHGAAETVIVGGASLENYTMLIANVGGTFGKPGKGFTVTQSGQGRGIVIDADDVAIRGNEFLTILPEGIGTGVEMVGSAGRIVFEQNHVVGWANGIIMSGPNKTVRKNVVTNCFSSGIYISAGSVVQGNVVTGSRVGIFLTAGAATITGNAVIGNAFGIANADGAPIVGPAFTGTIAKNNIYGNGCGVRNDGRSFVAADNYWGVPTGPGPDPADDVCNNSGGTTAVTPFATKPFKIKPVIKP